MHNSFLPVPFVRISPDSCTFSGIYNFCGSFCNRPADSFKSRLHASAYFLCIFHFYRQHRKNRVHKDIFADNCKRKWIYFRDSGKSGYKQCSCGPASWTVLRKPWKAAFGRKHRRAWNSGRFACKPDFLQNLQKPGKRRTHTKMRKKLHGSFYISEHSVPCTFMHFVHFAEYFESQRNFWGCLKSSKYSVIPNSFQNPYTIYRNGSFSAKPFLYNKLLPAT